jgi:hypothetical protein
MLFYLPLFQVETQPEPEPDASRSEPEIRTHNNAQKVEMRKHRLFFLQFFCSAILGIP